MKINGLELYKTSRMNLKTDINQNVYIHKRIYAVWFHVCKVQKQGELPHDVDRRGAGDQEETWVVQERDRVSALSILCPESAAGHRGARILQ